MDITKEEVIFNVVLYSSCDIEKYAPLWTNTIKAKRNCWLKLSVKKKSCKAVHQSLPGTRLKGLWCNNSLSFNLIFLLFSFPLRLFVCSHDFGCCLSSGGMYTCSSQMLVHLSALRCFWWSAMLLFFSSFFLHILKGFFPLFVLSVDFLSLH